MREEIFPLFFCFGQFGSFHVKGLSIPIQFLIRRDILKEFVGVINEVDVATIMVETVGYDEVGGFEYHIVTHDLVESLLRNPYRGSFVFYNHKRLC